MKIVVGGQIDKENVAEIIKKYIPEAEITIKNDIDAAMDVKLKDEVKAGKVAFGFTPQSAEQVIKIVAEYIK